MVRTSVRNIRIEAPAHDRTGIGLAFKYRDFCSHGLGRRKLILASERHKNSTRANSGVKVFYKTFLRANVKVSHKQLPAIGGVAVGFELFCNGYGNCNGSVFFRAVGVKKFSGKIYNNASVPCHSETGFFGNYSYESSFKIFFCCFGDESVRVLFAYDYSHAFLTFGNCKLSAVFLVPCQGLCQDRQQALLWQLKRLLRQSRCSALSF